MLILSTTLAFFLFQIHWLPVLLIRVSLYGILELQVYLSKFFHKFIIAIIIAGVVYAHFLWSPTCLFLSPTYLSGISLLLIEIPLQKLDEGLSHYILLCRVGRYFLETTLGIFLSGMCVVELVVASGTLVWRLSMT